MTGECGPKADLLRCSTFPQKSCDQQTFGRQQRVDRAIQLIDDSPHFPTPGAHDSHDSVIIELQTEVAHGAGITGFMANWWDRGSCRTCVPATWHSVGRRVAFLRKASTHIEWEECYPCIAWHYVTDIGFNRQGQGLVGAGVLFHIRIAGARDRHNFLPVLGRAARTRGNHP